MLMRFHIQINIKKLKHFSKAKIVIKIMSKTVKGKVGGKG